MTLYMGIVVYAPALALSAVTGLNFTGSVISIGDDDDEYYYDDHDLPRPGVHILLHSRGHQGSPHDGCVPVTPHVCCNILCHW